MILGKKKTSRTVNINIIVGTLAEERLTEKAKQNGKLNKVVIFVSTLEFKKILLDKHRGLIFFPYNLI